MARGATAFSSRAAVISHHKAPAAGCDNRRRDPAAACCESSQRLCEGHVGVCHVDQHRYVDVRRHVVTAENTVASRKTRAPPPPPPQVWVLWLRSREKPQRTGRGSRRTSTRGSRSAVEAGSRSHRSRALPMSSWPIAPLLNLKISSSRCAVRQRRERARAITNDRQERANQTAMVPLKRNQFIGDVAVTASQRRQCPQPPNE